MRNGDKGPLSWSAEREGWPWEPVLSENEQQDAGVLRFYPRAPESWDWQELTRNSSSSKSLPAGIGIPAGCGGLCSGAMEFQLLGT